MFDIGWEKLFLIGAVALVAIGPKDLPKALRTAGRAVGKMRRMASEFQAQFNEAIREADLEDLRKTASDINDAVTPFKSEFNPLKDVDEQLQKAVGPLPAAADPVVPAPEPAAVPEPAAAPEKKPAGKTARSKPAATAKAGAPRAKTAARKVPAARDAAAKDAEKIAAPKKPATPRTRKKAEKLGESAK